MYDILNHTRLWLDFLHQPGATAAHDIKPKPAGTLWQLGVNSSAMYAIGRCVRMVSSMLTAVQEPLALAAILVKPPARDGCLAGPNLYRLETLVEIALAAADNWRAMARTATPIADRRESEFATLWRSWTCELKQRARPAGRRDSWWAAGWLRKRQRQRNSACCTACSVHARMGNCNGEINR